MAITNCRFKYAFTHQSQCVQLLRLKHRSDFTWSLWESFTEIFRFQQAKLIRKLIMVKLWIGLACCHSENLRKLAQKLGKIHEGWNLVRSGSKMFGTHPEWTFCGKSSVCITFVSALLHLSPGYVCLSTRLVVTILTLSASADPRVCTYVHLVKTSYEVWIKDTCTNLCAKFYAF